MIASTTRNTASGTDIASIVTILPDTEERPHRRVGGRSRPRTSATSVSRGWKAKRASASNRSDAARGSARTRSDRSRNPRRTGRCACSGGRAGAVRARSKRRIAHLVARHLRSRRATEHSSGGNSRTSTAWLPPSSESSQNRARSWRTLTDPVSQPAGSAATHGTDVADGTDCAMRIMRLPVPHVGFPDRPATSAGVQQPERRPATPRTSDERGARVRSTMRRGPHRCSEIGRRSGASARNCATRSRPSCFMTDRNCVGLAMPRAAANASAISSGVKYCSARVYTRSGVGAHREDEHHVGEVDGLPPRRRSHLREGHVDEEDVAVLHHQVRGLDVAVGQARVPELADQRQALVDDVVVDRGVTDLLRAVEELGDEQVLALGRELDDARRTPRSGCRSRA